jgi:hypothetical protein
MSGQLQQQKLSFHSSGRVEAKRPGPAPKPLTTASSALIHSHRRRRKVGGINELNVIRAFQQSRAHQDAGEPDSDASASDSDNGPRIKLRRMGYSREKKLQAVAYYENTDMPGKKGMLDVPISASLACKNLSIDRHCLRD